METANKADRLRASQQTEVVYELGKAGVDNPDRQLLYHYTRAEVALEAILPNRTLRLSPYSSMRDPLEYRELPLMMRYSGTSSPRLPLRRAQEIISDLRAQMRILSMTMDAEGYTDEQIHAFGRGYARPRMWEQYAENHTGVCLAFSSSCLTGAFVNEMEREGAYNIGPVRYTEGGFVVSDARLLDGDQLREETAVEALTKHIVRHNRDFWFLKLLDWETEYEYRFVLFNPTVPSDQPIDIPFGPCLKGIVLGERFDNDDLDRIRELSAELDVPLVRLDWRGGRPSTLEIRATPS
jgi:hypothetical protein